MSNNPAANARTQTENDAAAGIPFEVSMPITQPRAIGWMLCRAMLPELVVAWLALAAPVAAAERCMVTDPTGTALNVRRFDGKVIGALHDGEIVKILRTSANRNSKDCCHDRQDRRFAQPA